MSARRNLLVVGEASSLVLQVLLAIHSSLDARCIVRVRRGARVLRLSPLCADYGELDLRGEGDARFVDTVNRCASARPDLVLIPADCVGARLLNRVRPQLRAPSIPAPDLPMLDQLEDKWSFFQLCGAQGLPSPPTELLPSKEALHFAATARALGLPFVVKPVNGYSARGVEVICSEEDFRRKIRDREEYRYAPLVVQRYIRGEDVGVNLLALHGRIVALSIQQRVRQQQGGDGAQIRFFSHEGLERAAHTLVQASGYHGVMNVDARIEEGSGQVFLFESNPRFWRSLLASAWCGLNFVAESLTPARTGPVHRLTSGSADTYFHPLYRPALWRYVLFDAGERGRMARCMLDPCLLADSTRAVLRWRLGKDPLALASAPHPPVALQGPAARPSEAAS
jgi:hypothetical protein